MSDVKLSSLVKSSEFSYTNLFSSREPDCLLLPKFSSKVVDDSEQKVVGETSFGLESWSPMSGSGDTPRPVPLDDKGRGALSSSICLEL